MREGEVYNQVSNLKKRIAVIYRQMVFLDARLQAFEGVFQNTTWFERLFKTKDLMKRVDALHLALMQKHDEDMKRSSEEIRYKAATSLIKPNGIHV